MSIQSNSLSWNYYHEQSLTTRLSDLVSLVNDGLQLESSTAVDRQAFGEHLKVATAQFTIDYIPHMREEEEVSPAVSSGWA